MNVDTIFGFDPGDDRIALDAEIFGEMALGRLDGEAFARGSASREGDDRILYNPETGALLFDPDGSGAAAAVQFANVSTGLASLGANDFIVI